MIDGADFVAPLDLPRLQAAKEFDPSESPRVEHMAQDLAALLGIALGVAHD